MRAPLVDTPFHRRMAEGHEIRTGHQLVAHNVSGDGVLWHIVRDCCGETDPANPTTWTEMFA